VQWLVLVNDLVLKEKHIEAKVGHQGDLNADAAARMLVYRDRRSRDHKPSGSMVLIDGWVLNHMDNCRAYFLNRVDMLFTLLGLSSRLEATSDATSDADWSQTA
jgi:hypothetical protein